MQYILPLLALIVTPLQDDSQSQARALVEKLKSDRIEEREQASAKLVKLGPKAIPELEKAALSGDAEFSARARKVLEELKARVVFDPFEKAVLESASVKFKVKGSSSKILAGRERREAVWECTIFVKTGDRLVAEVVRALPQRGFPRTRILMRSDGSSLVVKQATDSPVAFGRILKDLKVKRGTSEYVKAALTRSSWIYESWNLSALLEEDGRARLPRSEDTFALSRLKFEGTDVIRGIEASAVSYALRFSGRDASVKLWIAPKKRMCLRRVIEYDDGLQKTRIREDYEDLSTDDLPDSHFTHTILGEGAPGKVSATQLAEIARKERSGNWSGLSSALIKERSVESVPILSRLTKDGDPQVRLRVSSLLGQLLFEEGRPALIPLLRDGDAGVRRNALNALARMGEEFTPGDMGRLVGDDDNDIRDLAIHVSGELRILGVAPLLVKLLEKDDPKLRSRILGALGAMGSGSKGAEIERFLNDEDPLVRAMAGITLGRWGSMEHAGRIAELLKEPEGKERFRVLYALGELKAREQLPAITALLGDKDSSTRHAAIGALHRIGDKSSVEDLKPLLSHEDFNTQLIAAATICELGSEASVKQILNGNSGLDSLNALRSPKLWAMLNKKTHELGLDLRTYREYVERLLTPSGLTVEWPDALSGEDSKWCETPRPLIGWGMRSKDVLSELRMLIQGRFAFVLGEGRIRLLKRENALVFWQGWWEREAPRSVIKAWLAAGISGDGKGMFETLSTGFKSDWVLTQLLAKEAVMEAWRDGLLEKPRSILEAWMTSAGKNRGRRPPALPDSILELQSLQNVFIDHFQADRKTIKSQFVELKVKNVAVDDSRATVSVRNPQGRIELYSLILQKGSWKLDGHLQSAPSPKDQNR